MKKILIVILLLTVFVSTSHTKVWWVDENGNILSTNTVTTDWMFSNNITSFTAVALENGTSVDEFSTDGTLGGDSDNAVPTEKATKTYIDGVAFDIGADTGALRIDVDLNNTHRTSNDGSDHSFIDQSVVTDSTPTFGGLKLNGNVTAHLLIGDGTHITNLPSGDTTAYQVNTDSVTIGNPNYSVEIDSDIVFNGDITGIDNDDLPNPITVLVSSFPHSGVSAGSYTASNITVNAQGFVTAAANGAAPGDNLGNHIATTTLNMNGNSTINQSSITAVNELNIFTNSDHEGGLGLDSYNFGGDTMTYIESLGGAYIAITGVAGGALTGLQWFDPSDLTNWLATISADNAAEDLVLNAKGDIKLQDDTDITGDLSVSGSLGEVDISTIAATNTFRIYTNGDQKGGIKFDRYFFGGSTSTCLIALGVGSPYIGIAGKNDGIISGIQFLSPTDLTDWLGTISANSITGDITINAKDEIILSDVTTLADSSQLASSAAPTSDADIANKKYVDDNAGGAAASDSIGWSFPNSAYTDMVAYRKVIDTFTITDTSGGVAIEINYTSDGSASSGTDEWDVLVDSGTGFYSILTVGDELDIATGTYAYIGVADLVQVEYPNGSVFKVKCDTGDGGSPILIDIHGQYKENE